MVVFSGIFICWILFLLLLCFQGFGSDTDAWLMARTAALLRAGEGYDPARSLGNPLWEFLLALLQPGMQFLYSNLMNLLLGLAFLWRLNALKPELSTPKHILCCLLFYCLPLFTEAASSSMELMPAWLLWLECLIAFRFGKEYRFALLFAMLCITRAEFLLLLTPVFYFRKSWVRYGLPGIILWLCFFWFGLGKNPPPFSDLGTGLRFYAGRGWFLARQAGLMLPLYLFFLWRCFRQPDILLRWSGLLALLVFCLFPFEWAYVFPALFVGIVSLPEHFSPLFLRRLLAASAVAALISFWISPLSGLAGLYFQRKTMLAQYRMAQQYQPKVPALLLDGATFLPSDYRLWQRSRQNRLFQKKESKLFVSERLSRAELDSFRLAGFRLYRFSGKCDAGWLQQAD